VIYNIRASCYLKEIILSLTLNVLRHIDAVMRCISIQRTWED